MKWQINENYHNWKFEQINKVQKHSVKRVSGGWGAIEQTEVTRALKSSRTESSLFDSFNFPQDIQKQVFSY